MIVIRKGETRLEYLTRVLQEYMTEHGDNPIDYDETTCDGCCLADDFAIELEMIDE